jgi:hypothetical protein
MDADKRKVEFARAAQTLPDDVKPPADVMALGYLMRDWLQAAVVDAGTSVDTGAGLQVFDLWAKVGGREVFITIKERASEIGRSSIGSGEK